jgi:arginyl-tRNA--protein-N-Asp/Glu arginylyltransferase
MEITTKPQMPEEYRIAFNKYMRLYRQKNNESIQLSRKKWVKNNPIKVKENNKKNSMTFYERNKETLLKPICCETCGGRYSIKSKNQHFKSKKHNNNIVNNLEPV